MPVREVVVLNPIEPDCGCEGVTHRHARQVVGTCDSCWETDLSWTSPSGTAAGAFEDLVGLLRSEGWAAAQGPDGWVLTCPNCVVGEALVAVRAGATLGIEALLLEEIVRLRDRVEDLEDWADLAARRVRAGDDPIADMLGYHPQAATDLLVTLRHGVLSPAMRVMRDMAEQPTE